MALLDSLKNTWSNFTTGLSSIGSTIGSGLRTLLTASPGGSSSKTASVAGAIPQKSMIDYPVVNANTYSGFKQAASELPGGTLPSAVAAGALQYTNGQWMMWSPTAGVPTTPSAYTEPTSVTSALDAIYAGAKFVSGVPSSAGATGATTGFQTAAPTFSTGQKSAQVRTGTTEEGQPIYKTVYNPAGDISTSVAGGGGYATAPWASQNYSPVGGGGISGNMGNPYLFGDQMGANIAEEEKKKKPQTAFSGLPQNIAGFGKIPGIGAGLAGIGGQTGMPGIVAGASLAKEMQNFTSVPTDVSRIDTSKITGAVKLGTDLASKTASDYISQNREAQPTRQKITDTFVSEVGKTKAEIDAAYPPVPNLVLPPAEIKDNPSLIEMYTKLAQESGLSTFEVQRVDLMKSIATLQKAFQQTADQITADPDYPRALAERMINDLAKKANTSLSSLSNQLQITEQQIGDLNDKIKFRMGLYETEYKSAQDQQNEMYQRNRDSLQRYIESGGIVNATDADLQRFVDAGVSTLSELRGIQDAIRRGEKPEEQDVPSQNIGGVDSKFFDQVDEARKLLESGTPWGSIWNRIKQMYPNVSDEEINQYLGGTEGSQFWRQGGAYETYAFLKARMAGMDKKTVESKWKQDNETRKIPSGVQSWIERAFSTEFDYLFK